MAYFIFPTMVSAKEIADGNAHNDLPVLAASSLCQELCNTFSGLHKSGVYINENPWLEPTISL